MNAETKHRRYYGSITEGEREKYNGNSFDTGEENEPVGIEQGGHMRKPAQNFYLVPFAVSSQKRSSFTRSGQADRNGRERAMVVRNLRGFRAHIRSLT